VLKRLYGPKTEEVAGEWGTLHNVRNLYAPPNIIRVIISRKMRQAGHVASMREMRNSFKNLVGNSEGKKSLGGPRRRYEDNIRMDVRKQGRKLWTGCIWLRTGTSGGPLRTRKGDFGFHKKWNFLTN